MNVAAVWLAGLVVTGLTFAAVRAEDGIVIASGQVKLAASFQSPTGNGPFPAVAIIAGSGPQHRNAFRELTGSLIGRGIAVLSYDKRGCGQSTGDLSAATLGELTDDASAVTAYLETRKDVDRKRIALIGMSQGGLIAPAVAAQRADVAAIVLLGAPFAAYASLSYFSPAVTYNPTSKLRQVKIPVLALTGSLDQQAPATENLPVIREALAGNPDASVAELPGRNHIFLLARTGGTEKWGGRPAYADPAMLAIVGDWLVKRMR